MNTNARSTSDTPSIVSLARVVCKSATPIYKTPVELSSELRERRKRLLGSYISLQNLVCANGSIIESTARELRDYLAEKTILFWKDNHPDKNTFCQQFYELAIYAIAGGNVGQESVDDIIRLAECLVHSRQVFVIVMKKLLLQDMIGNMFGFVDSCDDQTFSPDFEDAVLAAVSVLLGVLQDPSTAD